eukprot:152569_1
MIYSKHPGDFKANDPFKNSKNKNNIGDKALCIAKCIEIENGYPILSMLLDTFSRDRVNGHKINTTIYNLSISDDRYAIRYDAIKWWNEDCIFGRYISKKYPNKADAMMHAVAELSFRVLPKYNFQYVLSHIICDSLNAFVKYTISFHHVIHKIIKSMSLAGHCEAAPLQFDFWIIPQATKPTTRMNNIYDEKELYSDNDNDDDDNTVQYEYEKYEKNKINQDYIHENLIYNEMGKSGYHQKAQNAFWDLEEYLIKDGYKENIDYFVQGITGDIGLRTEQIIKMWKLSADADRIRYKRYIIIIDRRNPMNLRHKNMDYKTPNIYKSEIQWKDRLYLIKPKLTTKNSNGKLQFKKKDVQNITKKFYLVPEALLGYSKTYLFPNPDKHEPGPICILDAINGYKFCLSYHILQTDCVKVYWYTNQGSQRFKLDDMKWLWSKCFQKINNQWQTINNENMELLNDNIYGKDLIDAKFQEFWRQIHDINNVHFKPFLTSNNELFREEFKYAFPADTKITDNSLVFGHYPLNNDEYSAPISENKTETNNDAQMKQQQHENANVNNINNNNDQQQSYQSQSSKIQYTSNLTQLSTCSQPLVNLEIPKGTLFKESTQTICSSIANVIQVLENYQQISAIVSKQRETFIERCHNTYQSLPDDFIHIITEHQNDQTVVNLNHNNCDISNCASSKRHQRLSPLQTTLTGSDEFIFWTNLLDSLHFFILHRYKLAAKPKNDARFQRFNITQIKQNDDKTQTFVAHMMDEKNEDDFVCSEPAQIFNQNSMKQSISFDRSQRFNIAKYITKIPSNSDNAQPKMPHKDKDEKKDSKKEEKQSGNHNRHKYNANKMNENNDDEDDSDSDDSSDEEDSDDSKENENKDVIHNKSALDQLFDYMRIQGISIKDINTCITQLISEEYDTDSFMDDVIKNDDQITHSNCKNMSPSDECYNIMVDFKYILNIQQRCFQIGFIFYYWKYYEYEGTQRDKYFSQNDHSGYKPHQ